MIWSNLPEINEYQTILFWIIVSVKNEQAFLFVSVKNKQPFLFDLFTVFLIFGKKETFFFSDNLKKMKRNACCRCCPSWKFKWWNILDEYSQTLYFSSGWWSFFVESSSSIDWSNNSLSLRSIIIFDWVKIA